MGCGGSVCGSDEPAPPPHSTPRLPLTAKERSCVVSSWNTIHRALEPIGVYMFVNLFQEHAELLDFFEKFGRLRSREAQAESLELAEHACIVMGALHHSVTALQEPARFCSTLHAIGGSHTRVPGFRKELFWKIRRPFLESVAVTLRGGYTMQTAQLYRSTIDLILRTVSDGFQLAQRSQLDIRRDTSAIGEIRDVQELNRDKGGSPDLQHMAGTKPDVKALDIDDF